MGLVQESVSSVAFSSVAAGSVCKPRKHVISPQLTSYCMRFRQIDDDRCSEELTCDYCRVLLMCCHTSVIDHVVGSGSFQHDVEDFLEQYSRQPIRVKYLCLVMFGFL